ncbi:MAG: DUF3883 domain-containing protein [Bryobacteraceae bacterium]|nr:DUF3883 domain-containing protein [Bryobacteraceae bacterium]
MIPIPENLTPRDKMVMAGLFLAKFDLDGVRKLGFASFAEAFNVIGYALRGRPASIKNYRDEFDPLFPNRRKGWHKRQTRDYCMKVFESYKHLDLNTFAALLRSFFGYDADILSEIGDERASERKESVFALRLATGLAAEHYFESVQPTIPEFRSCFVENLTRLGCGYDYRLTGGGFEDFVALEVKGLTGKNGSVSFTPKEHAVAADLGERFVLFVVKNFSEKPFHEIYRNPIAGGLHFKKRKRITVHISWVTKV